MNTDRIAVAIEGTGVYREHFKLADGSRGAFTGRFLDRKNNWRVIPAKTKREAIRIVSARDPGIVAGAFKNLAQLYIDSDCPNASPEPRTENFIKEETARARTLIERFDTWTLDELAREGISVLPDYARWRVARLTRRRGKASDGFRTVDKDMQTMSNIFSFATFSQPKLFSSNPFYKRTRYQKAKFVSHSRDRAPKTGDAIHQIADHLFDTVRTEVAGWFCYFAMFSSCRVTELLRLRMTAKKLLNDRREEIFEPGHIRWIENPRDPNCIGQLHLGCKETGGGRCKGGIEPEINIGPEFAQMIECFRRWHSARYPDCDWYFPNRMGDGPIDRWVVRRQIVSACIALGLPHVTPHGFRSFYVTKRRSDGASDAVIAGELGDQTIALMQTTYGKRPDNLKGGEPLSWLPKERLAGWLRWKDAQSKIIRLT